MYDRDDSEKRQNSEMNAYFKEMHERKVEEDKTNSSLRKSDTLHPSMRQVLNMKNMSRTVQRPQSTIPSSSSSMNRRQMSATAIAILAGASNGNVDSLVFGS